MKTTLIITKSDDHSGVDAVIAHLAHLGVRGVRVDTDRYPLDVRVSSLLLPDGTTRRRWRVPHKSGGVVDVDANDVCSVYYRRYFAGGALPLELGDLRVPAVDESRRALYGAIAALDVPQLDRLEDVRRCDHKELQLSRARALGLAIPRTLFSNDPDAVGAFYDDVTAAGGTVITKMQSSFAVYRDDQELVVFTSVVSEHDRHDLAGLRYCPMQFQELVPKQLELRATVVGDEVFCAAVDSMGHSEATHIDWRKDGVGLLKKWAPYTLPSSTSAALLQLVRSFGLSYAAADFIVTPAGEHVFLEINAGGEWHWLDDSVPGSAGLPIARAIARFLARPAG